MRYPEAVALIGLAVTGRCAGDRETALAHAREAVTLSHDIGYRCLEGQALTALADIHLAHAEPAEAADHAQHALAIHRETGQRLHQAHTHLLLGHTRRRLQGLDVAVPHWQEALTLFVASGSPHADRVRRLTSSLAT
jgi:tetratricopeptide (TPR) repeat protein